MSRLFLHSSLPLAVAGSGAGGCPGPGAWGAEEWLAVGLSGWGPERGSGSGDSGSTLPGTQLVWAATILMAADIRPLPHVCEARRWDRDKAAPTSLVLGLGDEPGGRKINHPTPTPENYSRN